MEEYVLEIRGGEFGVDKEEWDFVSRPFPSNRPPYIDVVWVYKSPFCSDPYFSSANGTAKWRRLHHHHNTTYYNFGRRHYGTLALVIALVKLRRARGAPLWLLIHGTIPHIISLLLITKWRCTCTARQRRDMPLYSRTASEVQDSVGAEVHPLSIYPPFFGAEGDHGTAISNILPCLWGQSWGSQKPLLAQ
jgi:hypothetical protein